MPQQAHYTISITPIELATLLAALHSAKNAMDDIAENYKHIHRKNNFYRRQADILECIILKAKASEHGHVIFCELENDYQDERKNKS
jgi:hypothetical protein